MKNQDDNDAGSTPERDNQDDVAVSDSYGFLRKKLTKEESNSPAVIQMMLAHDLEMRKENDRLRCTEIRYNDLRVDYARLDEMVEMGRREAVFCDLVLVLAPLFIGIVVDVTDLMAQRNLIVVVPLLILTVGALVARYSVPVKFRKSKHSKSESSQRKSGVKDGD